MKGKQVAKRVQFTASRFSFSSTCLVILLEVEHDPFIWVRGTPTSPWVFHGPEDCVYLPAAFRDLSRTLNGLEARQVLWAQEMRGVEEERRDRAEAPGPKLD